jgi:hypothetical protein
VRMCCSNVHISWVGTFSVRRLLREGTIPDTLLLANNLAIRPARSVSTSRPRKARSVDDREKDEVTVASAHWCSYGFEPHSVRGGHAR